MSEEKNEKAVRVLPLPKVTGIWDHSMSQYPDRVRIPMADGNVVTYRIDVEMPHPQCLKTLEIIRMMNGHTYGETKK